ncbi:FHA domain-containing protein, partial [Candidatus Leptofilum sp.]|uniref:FHA domain-containing protein n=1 Tax=Candidatus Leptofilum sp. TaxID=3241576 RepID=UPI003B5B7B4B
RQAEVDEVPTRTLQQPFSLFMRPKRSIQELPDLCGLRFDLRDGQSVTIEGLSNIIMGRQMDNERQIDLDLSAYGGLEKGVSRTHACLQVTDEAVYVRDLNSSNSTFLNGCRTLSLA